MPRVTSPTSAAGVACTSDKEFSHLVHKEGVLLRAVPRPRERAQPETRPFPAQVVQGAVTTTRRTMKIAGLALFAMVFVFAFFGWPTNLLEDAATHRRVLAALFITGITLVALEDVLRLDKSAIMLVLASVMWTYHAAGIHARSAEGHELLEEELMKGLFEVGSVILFLLPAMCVVESIDHMNGFAVVTAFIVRRTQNKAGRLMPIVCIIAFFLSSVIDNLTATIVCIKILQRVVPHNQDWRHSCGGVVVVAANAGGAWSPIGDVTTTMLWIQHKVSTAGIITWTFVPSMVAGFIPLFGIWWQARRCGPKLQEGVAPPCEVVAPSRNSIIVLLVGFGCILMVPVVKMVTGLPPYLGMMMALGSFWLVTEICDLGAEVAARDEEAPEDKEGPAHHSRRGVPAALHKVDISSLLFFTGVLLGVAVLEAAQVLSRYSKFMREVTLDNELLLSGLLGVSSAVVDNVPLVQASIEMFEEPVDDPLWQLVALGAGTGGSMLAVGSVAGVTLMGLEGVGFLWQGGGAKVIFVSEFSFLHVRGRQAQRQGAPRHMSWKSAPEYKGQYSQQHSKRVQKVALETLEVAMEAPGPVAVKPPPLAAQGQLELLKEEGDGFLRIPAPKAAGPPPPLPELPPGISPSGEYDQLPVEFFLDEDVQGFPEIGKLSRKPT
ncbi:NHD1 [Symbiodinium natans]|uniref:NHD1 protein n=1 Tax=Symbiodinium natans TaxID=878477 RepID=A0A812JQ26_9DINO|nr:NHD1 [Symbiodinium natans]